MFGIEHLGLFVVAGVVLNLTPGPDVLFIVSRALRDGRRAGGVAALGITAGCCVHIVAAAAGVSALLASSAAAFNLLKWAGAAYLGWVGLRMLLSRGGSVAPELIAKNDPPALTSGSIDLKKVFLQGFGTNVLNPKVALFFLAFVPQFIAPQAPSPAGAFLALGLVFSVNGLLINLGWAVAASWLASRTRALNRCLHWLDRVAGALFIGFGLKLALTDAPSR